LATANHQKEKDATTCPIVVPRLAALWHAPALKGPPCYYGLDLITWGDLDTYAAPELADRAVRLCRTSRVLHVPEAGHWIHHEQPDRVGALVEEFLTGPA
jgi:hypothetical protein